MSASAVSARRIKLRIPAFVGPSRVHWGPTELRLLGMHNDEELAMLTGRTVVEVRAKRSELEQERKTKQ